MAGLDIQDYGQKTKKDFLRRFGEVPPGLNLVKRGVAVRNEKQRMLSLVSGDVVDGVRVVFDYADQLVAIPQLCHAEVLIGNSGLAEPYSCRVAEISRADSILLAGIVHVL